MSLDQRGLWFLKINYRWNFSKPQLPGVVEALLLLVQSTPSDRGFPALKDHREVESPRSGYWRAQPGLYSPLHNLQDNSKMFSIVDLKLLIFF